MLLHTTGSSQQKGMLVSPGISTWLGTTHCLQFWYHVAGGTDNDTTLRVKLQRANGTLTHALWGQNGNRGSGWNQAVVPIADSKPFRVRE